MIEILDRQGKTVCEEDYFSVCEVPQTSSEALSATTSTATAECKSLNLLPVLEWTSLGRYLSRINQQ